MNKVNIYFKNHDYIEKECTDVLLDHGMLILFYKPVSEDLEDVASEGFNVDVIENFELIRMMEEENEGISEEQQH